MKKKLEADLISIAHRILQLKNKSDVNQLFLETQKLYEKLAVLRFVEEHFGDPKPTIGQAEVVEKMKEFFENIKVPEFQTSLVKDKIVLNELIAEETLEEETLEEETLKEALEEEVIEDQPIINGETELPLSEDHEIITEVEFLESNDSEAQPISEVIEDENFAEINENPIEAIASITEITEINSAKEQPEDVKKDIKTEAPKKTEAVQISFEDLLGGNYTEPQFVKRSQLEQTSANKSAETILPFDFQTEPISNAIPTLLEKEEPKISTLNDKLSKGISIGLNDRIAFVKHLFAGDNEDYNRVLNQLITFDNFQDTKNFIDEMVKPDYNNWVGKEDYEHRFMEIIEKKFLSF